MSVTVPEPDPTVVAVALGIEIRDGEAVTVSRWGHSTGQEMVQALVSSGTQSLDHVWFAHDLARSVDGAASVVSNRINEMLAEMRTASDAG